MFVLEVIPFSRTAPGEALSYRSSTKVGIGTLVRVPLRRKNVLGLVVGCVPVQEAKYMLKSATFSLSKSTGDTGTKLSATTLAAAKKIAEYHATTLGAVLTEMIVPVIPASDDEISEKELSSVLAQRARKEKEIKFLLERCEAPFIDRAARYLEILKSGTVLLVVPTLTEATEWAEILRAHKPLVLTGKVTGHRRDAALRRAFGASECILTTPSFASGLAALLPNLSHIIVERTSAGSYSLIKRPYLDVRRTLESIAEERSTPITFGDYPLPLEYRTDPSAPLSRAPDCDIEIYDSRRVPGEDSKWNALAPALIQKISTAIKNGERVGVLAVRRGYAPVVVCRDCGTAVTDENGRNLTLATIKGKRVFRSADGHTVQSTKVLCTNCQSWNLMPLGIGIERVEEELQAAFPNTPILRIDADSTSVKALKGMRERLKEPGTIVLGTELMIPWLSANDPLDLAIIASADSLLAMPFWRARERFIRVSLMLAERSKKLIVATRLPEDIVMTAIQSQTTSKFWEEETSLRKMLKYPPFGTLVIIHAEASRAQIERLRNDVLERISPLTPLELPERAITTSVIRATFVLQIPKDKWPDASLCERLSTLPPNVRIHSNAESFW